MEYRTNRRTGDRMSIIGIGSGSIYAATETEAIEALSYAYENGMNLMDFATAGAAAFSYAGKAFSSVRDRMLYQVHFGTDYETGEYGWTTDLDKIKTQVEWQLGKLGTDYIDYGFIHCLDAESDWEAYQRNGVLAAEYANRRDDLPRIVAKGAGDAPEPYLALLLVHRKVILPDLVQLRSKHLRIGDRVLRVLHQADLVYVSGEVCLALGGEKDLARARGVERSLLPDTLQRTRERAFDAVEVEALVIMLYHEADASLQLIGKPVRERGGYVPQAQLRS